MEFIIVTSQYIRQPNRERTVIQAVVGAAETIVAEKVTVGKGNV